MKREGAGTRVRAHTWVAYVLRERERKRESGRVRDVYIVCVRARRFATGTSKQPTSCTATMVRAHAHTHNTYIHAYTHASTYIHVIHTCVATALPVQ